MVVSCLIKSAWWRILGKNTGSRERQEEDTHHYARLLFVFSCLYTAVDCINFWLSRAIRSNWIWVAYFEEVAAHKFAHNSFSRQVQVGERNLRFCISWNNAVSHLFNKKTIVIFSKQFASFKKASFIAVEYNCAINDIMALKSV